MSPSFDPFSDSTIHVNGLPPKRLREDGLAAFRPLETFRFALLAEAIYDCSQHMSTAPIARMPLLTSRKTFAHHMDHNPILELSWPAFTATRFFQEAVIGLASIPETRRPLNSKPVTNRFSGFSMIVAQLKVNAKREQASQWSITGVEKSGPAISFMPITIGWHRRTRSDDGNAKSEILCL
jgi:hypothetical protein